MSDPLPSTSFRARDTLPIVPLDQYPNVKCARTRTLLATIQYVVGHGAGAAEARDAEYVTAALELLTRAAGLLWAAVRWQNPGFDGAATQILDAVAEFLRANDASAGSPAGERLKDALSTRIVLGSDAGPEDSPANVAAVTKDEQMRMAEEWCKSIGIRPEHFLISRRRTRSSRN